MSVTIYKSVPMCIYFLNVSLPLTWKFHEGGIHVCQLLLVPGLFSACYIVTCQVFDD